jgi:hypothetical protein
VGLLTVCVRTPGGKPLPVSLSPLLLQQNIDFFVGPAHPPPGPGPAGLVHPTYVIVHYEPALPPTCPPAVFAAQITDLGKDGDVSQLGWSDGWIGLMQGAEKATLGGEAESEVPRHPATSMTPPPSFS